jgi:hypothetical protein
MGNPQTKTYSCTQLLPANLSDSRFAISQNHLRYHFQISLGIKRQQRMFKIPQSKEELARSELTLQ